jgi:tetratricopeptide (TPR) repeat protein
MTATPPDFEGAGEHWRHALRLAPKGSDERLVHEMNQRVLGRAQAFLSQDRMEDAVGLLDVFHQASSEPLRDEIAGRLASVLTQRGCERANRGGDWAGALMDFERAVELNPHVALTHGFLVAARRHRALESMQDGQLEAGAALFRKAEEGLRQSQDEFPENESLETEKKLLKRDRTLAALLCNSRAVAEADETKYRESLDHLWIAYDLAKDEPTVGRNLCEITAKHARDLIVAGARLEAREAVGRALDKFPRDRDLLRAEELVR